MDKGMELLIRDIKKVNKPVVIFGAGNNGKIAGLSLLDGNDEIEIVGYFDNNWSLWGKRVIGELYCEKPTLRDVFCVVAVSKDYQSEVCEQLRKIGYIDIGIWPIEERNESEKDVLRYISLLNKRTPKKKLYFVVDIVEHCNLNCQMCDHFAPLSEDYYMPLEAFVKDINRINNLFHGDIPFICIEGGEPLLHPEIGSFISEAKKILKNTEIQIFTSGILLPKMSNEFWNECKKNNVVLAITQYPIHFDYNNMEELASMHNVTLKYFGGKVVTKQSMHKPIDLQGNQDKYKNFDSCYMANGECADLKNGRLYPCTFVANLHIFNSYFNEHLRIGEKDYIDIHADTSAEEIMDFLCNPIPACKYCKVDKWSYDTKWAVSKKNIKEWI